MFWSKTCRVYPNDERKNPLIAEVFVRFHTYDLSAPEIAAELGIDKRTVYYLKEQGEQIRDRLMSM